MSDSDLRGIIENSQEASKHGEYYDKVWERLSQEYLRLQGYSKIRVEFIDYVISKYVSVEPNFNILDLGCGNGWLTAILSKYGNAYGVDFAPNAIAKAQETYGHIANYIVADPASPTLGLLFDKEYDLVVAARSIVYAGSRPPDLRLSPPDGAAETAKLAGESQACAAAHTRNGLAASAETAQDAHHQQRPYLPALPQPCPGCPSLPSRRDLGRGHHLCAPGTGVRVSGGHHGRVHPSGTRLASEPFAGSTPDADRVATGVSLWTSPAHPPQRPGASVCLPGLHRAVEAK